MEWLTARAILSALGIGGVGLVAARLALPRLQRPGPARGPEELSPEARKLVEDCFADVDRSRVWDLHVHVVGIGTGGSGCWVNPAMRSHWHPVRRFQYDVYLAGSGIRDAETADADYVDRLLAMHRLANPAGRLLLMAFDHQVGEDGEVRLGDSQLHVPNEYVAEIARRNPDVELCVSVHPYRRDAVARLEAAKDAGAIAVKWLPNAMGIDPASPLCDGFYDALVELGLVLITHAGVERSVHVAGAQELGNPLRLRRALDRGVKVVVAHCASLGRSRDLDAGGRTRRASFDLFLRLAGEKQYEANLFGDVSALTLVNRCGGALRTLLAAEDLHPRLVDGTDYPLPAIDVLVSTWLLARRGFLAPGTRPLVNEIFRANPLLFDYVLKRRLEVSGEGRTHRFSPIVFDTARVFG